MQQQRAGKLKEHKETGKDQSQGSIIVEPDQSNEVEKSGKLFQLEVNDFVYVSQANERKKKLFSQPEHYIGQILVIDKNDIELNFFQTVVNIDFVQTWVLKDEVHLKLMSPTIDRRLCLLSEEDDIDEMKECT